MRGSYRAHQFVNTIAPKALILLYHRVAEPITDPQLLCVTSDHFAEHMEIIRRVYHPLSLTSLRKRQALNLWHNRSVVVTFDDGYADNFRQGRTILEEHEIPATVFVTSGKVGTKQEFWWDELERIFLYTPTLPPQLDILILKKEYSWILNNTNLSSNPSSWNVLAHAQPTSRQQTYLDLMKILHDLPSKERDSVLSKLSDWANVDRNRGRQDYLSVGVEDLRSLPNNGLIEIGAHTVHHPVLSSLSLQSQKVEIEGSKKSLEEIIGRPVRTFAYPFGERGDYTKETVKLVRETGFTCACANFKGQVNFLSNPLQLPRSIVRDWDGETFARQLSTWFHE